jgi:mannosylglycoprotein endo-beta-mannosidase
MRVIHLFGNLHVENLHWLNSANVVLLPKKEGAEEVADFRPISLIHGIARIISKMLAIRLAPYMNDLVSNAQSAFIKKRSIHDNFLYVENLATRFHKSKIPALLLKLDIRKAFDSISWEYMLGHLQRRGFPPRFRDWVAALFTSASSRVLLNGIASVPILHGRGLRQGDSLSPLLFVIAIDPLAQILEKASHLDLLHKLRGRGTILRTSLFADDAAVFVAPIKEDLQNLAPILHRFGLVTGLCTNFNKSSEVPIRCGNIDLEDVLEGIPVTRASFPLRYLGLPLSVWCLRRRYFQHLEDKCASKLPTWNGKYVNMAGRTSLVKSVLASQAIYHLTPLAIPPGTLKYINKVEHAFLWEAKESTTGAKCKVNWESVCRPKALGGLSVLHMDKFATALRLRWPWFEWTDPNKLWVGLGNPCSEEDMNIFYAATTITLGNGKKTPFWDAPWLNGRAPKDIAPKIFESSKRKKCKVDQAIVNGAWIANITIDNTFSETHLAQFIELWLLVNGVQLHTGVEDSIVWKLTANGNIPRPRLTSFNSLGFCNPP